MRILVSLPVLLLLPLPSFAAIAAVTGAHACASAPAPNSAATTTPIDTTGANFIVISVTEFTSFSAVSDNKSNGAPAKLTTRTSGSTLTSLYYYASPTVGSGHTFTVAAKVSGYAVMCAAAFSGVAASSPFDKEDGNATASVVTTLTPAAAVTPAAAGSLIIASLGLGGASPIGTGILVGSGFTITDSQAGVVSTSFGHSLAYLIQGAAAAVQPVWTWTNAQASACTIAVFKPSSGAIRKRFVVSGGN